MRQLTPITNLLLALAFAAALAVALGLPWYAVAEPATTQSADGQIERGAATVARYFGASGSTATGADALATGEMLILGLAAATAGLSVLMLIPGVREVVRDVLKVVPLATPVVVAVQVLNPPAGMEIRYGVLAALALSGLMASAAFHCADLRGSKPAAQPFAAGTQHGSASRPRV